MSAGAPEPAGIPMSTGLPAAVRRVRVPAYPVPPRTLDQWKLRGLVAPDPMRTLMDATAPETVEWLQAQANLVAEWVDSHPEIPALEARLAALEEGYIEPSYPTPSGWTLYRGTARSPGETRRIFAANDRGDLKLVFDHDLQRHTSIPVFSFWITNKGSNWASALYTNGTDSFVLSENVATGATTHLTLTNIVPQRMAYLPNADALLVASHGTVWRQDLLTGAATEEFQTPGLCSDNRMSVSPDGRLIVISGFGAGDDRVTYVHDRVSGTTKPVSADVTHGLAVTTAYGDNGEFYLGALGGDVWQGHTAAPFDALREVVGPAGPHDILVDVEVTEGAVIRVLSQGGIARIDVSDPATGATLQETPFARAGDIGDLEVDGEVVRFCHSAPAVPETRYRFTLGGAEPVAEETAPIDLPGAHVEQLHAIAPDGTDVPYLVMRRADLPAATPVPAAVEVYGGFGLRNDPVFETWAAAWVEAGGAVIWALPRGGGDNGPEWAGAGRGMNKENTLNDTESIVRDAVARGIATPGAVATHGGSHGGMVAAEVALRCPDVVSAAAVQAPYTDLLEDTHAGGEFPRNKTAAEVEASLAMSPYHAALASGGVAPAFFVNVGACDNRVDPGHGAKLIAALQSESPQSLCLLRHDPLADHYVNSGARPYDAIAPMLAFMAEHTGLDLGPTLNPHQMEAASTQEPGRVAPEANVVAAEPVDDGVASFRERAGAPAPWSVAESSPAAVPAMPAGVPASPPAPEPERPQRLQYSRPAPAAKAPLTSPIPEPAAPSAPSAPQPAASSAPHPAAPSRPVTKPPADPIGF